MIASTSLSTANLHLMPAFSKRSDSLIKGVNGNLLTCGGLGPDPVLEVDGHADRGGHEFSPHRVHLDQ